VATEKRETPRSSENVELSLCNAFSAACNTVRMFRWHSVQMFTEYQSGSVQTSTDSAWYSVRPSTISSPAAKLPV
jgi:hypothetical protein